LMLAAAFTTAVLCTFADRSLATTITFTGVVDEIRVHANPAHLMVGDVFSATLLFNYRPGQFGGGGRVSRYFVSIDDFAISGTINNGGQTGGNLVLIDTDPSHGSVFYQLFEFFVPNADPYTDLGGSITLQTPTPNGVIPPIDQFALNDFAIFLDLPNDPFPESVIGHLTSLPAVTGLVPDSGTTVTLLSCAFLGMAALRRCLRDDGKG
jgi:hypothetical protein